LKTRFITLGGILTALSIILVYLSVIIPTSKLYLLALASMVIPVVIIMTNIRYGLLVYISTAILSLLLIGLVWNVVIYILFFGAYAFIKYLIERLNNLPLEYVMKYIFYNGSLILIYLFYKVFLFPLPQIKLPIYFIVILLEVIFLFYDYFLTIFITYINKRLKIKI